MRAFLRRLLKFTAYTAAGVVIALAIAVGLFRLFLPRLPEYQGEIKSWASAAIGMEVEFSGMDARWGLSGPELEFYDAELVRSATQARVIAAEEVRVGVALMRLLLEGNLVVDRVVVSGTSIEVRQLEDGRWWVQGSPAETLIGPRSGDSGDLTEVVVIGEDLEVIFLQPGDERPRFFDVPQVIASIDQNRLAVDADVRLPADLGRLLEVSATHLLTVAGEQRPWDIAIEASDIDLAGWSALTGNEQRRLSSGRGDLDLSMAYADGRIRDAIADIDFVDVALQGASPFNLQGRFELNAADNFWLVAAEEVRLTTADGAWPEARLRAEASIDEAGTIAMLDLRASYLRLDDLDLIAPWLGPEQRQMLTDYDPSGEVVDLVATVSDLATDDPGFDVEAGLQAVGVAADGDRPGLRGFSGRVRANRLGGRLEIQSTGLAAELPQYFAEAVRIDLAEGTVIWRSSESQTTVLSDSIRIGNDVFDSESNVQLTLHRDGTSPEIDLASTWNINDLSRVKAFIPPNIVKPKLYAWFQRAFAAGSIPRGTTVLKGPLDRFPFDNGEGEFRIEAAIRNLVFDYHPDWPVSDQSDMQVVLENTRLFSVRNQSITAGNRTTDATIEIADLRNPVLTIDAFSTGTLETIRQFTSQSPIADVFGGQLERITVSGDASFGLQLAVPLLRPKEFEFEARLRSTNGTMSIAGFGPQVTDLSGAVTIRRDDISSEAMGGTFLGEPVTIDLTMSEDPRFSVVATSRGQVSADSIVGELGVPLDGLISGAAAYQSQFLFPKADAEPPAQFTIRVESDLVGMNVGLPEPLDKPAETSLAIRGDIRFLDEGLTIESAGFTSNRIAWKVAFKKERDAWDLDRGMVAVGGDVMQDAETRGLHIRGETDTLRLDDWLEVARGREGGGGVAERIRSIDLVVDNLFAIGQHLQGHGIRVDRSARDWLVQLDGEHVVGSVFVPYDFGSDRTMVIEMQRMHLPGDDVSPDDDKEIDPRTLPPISLKAEDFALGDRHLGALDVQIDRIAEGLVANSISAQDDSFAISASGRWIVDETDPAGTRTYATGALVSTDVEATMSRLNFAPGIASQEMNVDFDLGFSGGPRADFLDVLDGNVGVEFGAGQLEEVEPGAGRVFGLMSITALPRRLSLDFRDVFNKGFGFDKIAGRFRIDGGEAYTCDLSLEGPAADIGIVGRASLSQRDYDQTAVVSANFGGSLPIVGAVVAGPQAAAALLIFSQIFKKPLQEVGQVYYDIGGSWDEPELESSSSDSFATSGELAGCLSDAE